MLLNNYLKDAKNDFGQLKAEAAAVFAEETELARRLAGNEAECNKYESYAIDAVKKGNDNDARKYLTYKVNLETEMEDLSSQYAHAKRNSGIMRQMLEKLGVSLAYSAPVNIPVKASVNAPVITPVKTPVVTPVASIAAVSMSAPVAVQTTKPIYVDAKSHWLQSASYLRQAMFLIGLQSILFDELSKKAVSKDMAPAFDIENDHTADGHKFFWFLEGLCGKEYIAYIEVNSECMDIAAALSRSAVRLGLPPIPDGLLEKHPTRSDPKSPTGETELLGGMAAVYIAKKVDYWRVYLISDGSDDYYVGAVSLLNADVFVKKMSDWFVQFNNEYSIYLLGKKG